MSDPEKEYHQRLMDDPDQGKPPCLVQSRIICRGCPGWTYMSQAFHDPENNWGIIHCPAIGLTLERKE